MSEPEARRFRGTPTTGRATTTAPSTTTAVTLEALAYDPVKHSRTTRPPVDHTKLEAVLAEHGSAGDEGSMGVSATTLALLLGIVALVLIGTGAFRRWMERG